jgi:hypothetical protein
MVRLLGRAFALLTLTSVLHIAEAASHDPTSSGMTATGMDSSCVQREGNTSDAERVPPDRHAREETRVRRTDLAPVLDDQLIPDRVTKKVRSTMV